MKKLIVIFVSAMLFAVPSLACASTAPLTKKEAQHAVDNAARHFHVKGGVHTVRAMNCVRYSTQWVLGCVAEALSKMTYDSDGSLQQSHCMVNATAVKNQTTGRIVVHLENDMYCGQF